MKRKINKIKLFYNDNKKSKDLVKKLEKKLIKNNFVIDDSLFDLGIAIGGDGSFLRMIRACSFSKDILYIGINTGTLGFAQEVNPNDLDSFINDLNNNKYKIETHEVQETSIFMKEEKFTLYSMNEITIRELELNTLKIRVYVDNYLLEKFEGDGLLISTTFGSTAYNLSFGGSIVHPSLKSLQITPIAPLNNRSYRNLVNSVVLPIEKEIVVKPISNKDILFTSDGVNYEYKKVDKIITTKRKDGIKVIRLKNYNFAKTINEKFLK